MSNILNSTSAPVEMEFQLEGTLRSLTMDNIPTENSRDGSGTLSLTKVISRNEYSKASEYTGDACNYTTEETTISRLL